MESKNFYFYWAAIASTEDSAIFSRAKERFLIIVSFVFTHNHGSSNLPKGANSES